MSNETLLLITIFIFMFGIIGGAYLALKEDKTAKKV